MIYWGKFHLILLTLMVSEGTGVRDMHGRMCA